MKIIKPSFTIEETTLGLNILKNIERAGRTCYKSEDKITETSCYSFVEMIIKRGHESVLEHEKVTVRIICDRGVSHELVRHRIASYSQESTRYCNYSQGKHGGELTYIEPYFWTRNEDQEYMSIWTEAMASAEKAYMHLLQKGAKPEEARAVLPNSLKTEIVVTMNLRQWRHFMNIRTKANVHPQMLEITIPLLRQLKEYIPVIFDDIYLKINDQCLM